MGIDGHIWNKVLISALMRMARVGKPNWKRYDPVGARKGSNSGLLTS